MKRPHFLNYKEESCDNGYETIQDMFLSWTIRYSSFQYAESNEKVYGNALRVVYLLIYGENRGDNYNVNWDAINSFGVKEVRSVRQESQIDLLCFVTLLDGSKYLLNIENKWYSDLSNGQLEKYKAYVDANYPEYNIVNLFIRCDDCSRYYKSEKETCRDVGYKFVTIDQIKEISGMEYTGDTLFDAYWFGDEYVGENHL